MLLLLPLLLCGCSVLFVSPYDEVTDRSANELTTRTEIFLVRYAARTDETGNVIRSGKSYDSEAAAFYNEAHGTVDAILLRSEQKEKIMNFEDTLAKMLAAAKTATGTHWKDMSSYLEDEFASAKDEAAAIAMEVAHRTKTPEQAKIEMEAIEESLRDVRLAATVDVKAAAQDAINAALDVLRAAVNEAAKVPIF